MNIPLLSMYLREKINVILLIFSVLILNSCARPEVPQGGPKDEDPPILLEANPSDQTINFDGDQIILEFDEWVQIKNINKQLLITPSIPKTFEIKNKKNKVILSNLELDSATTYTFNFREGVQDITENLPAENLAIVFSTGKYIDSLTVKGSIKNPIGRKIEKTIIGLYQNIDTISAFDTEPLYLTETDSLNKFEFTNLKSGLYKIFAIGDYNGNSKIESKIEPYAFKSFIVNTDSLKDDIELILTEGDIKEPRFLGARPKKDFYQVGLSKPIDTVIINNKTTDSLLYQINKEKDKVDFYNVSSLTEKDSIEIEVIAIDSLLQRIDTTYYVKFNPKEEKPTKLKSKLKKTFKTEIKLFEIGKDRILRTKLNFDKPVNSYKLDSTGIYSDSLQIAKYEDLNFKWNYNHTELDIKYKLDIDSLFKKLDQKNRGISTIDEKPVQYNLNLYLPKGSFINNTSDSSTNIFESIRIIDPDSKSEISGTVQCKSPTILRLLNRSNEIADECIHCNDFKFINLKPGEYTLQIIIDKNNDRKFNLGNYLQNIEPERSYTYPESTNIKPGWKLPKVIVDCNIVNN